MISTNSTTPIESDEKTKLEEEYQLKLGTLRDVLTLNDDLIGQNHQKDELLAKRESYLILTQQRNKEESIQLDLEEKSHKEGCEHEIFIAEENMAKLKRENERYIEVEKENEYFKDAVNVISGKIFSEGKKHAIEIHEMNKSMQLIRQEMEVTFRKKMTEMDTSFQKDAYKALNDEQKKDLLLNSKLKDELAIQQVGLANLLMRLSRQRTMYAQTQKDIAKLEKYARKLRKKCAQLHEKQTNRGEFVLDLQRESNQLYVAKDLYSKELNSWPFVVDIEQAIFNCEEETQKELKIADMWETRLQELNLLKSDLRLFVSRGIKDLSENSSVATHCINLSYIRESRESDEDLAKALEPLFGQESALVNGRGVTSMNENIVAYSINMVNKYI